MTFGNYVLFNLLVAILVEGFSSERIEREQREREAEARAAARAAKVLEYNATVLINGVGESDNLKALALESPPPGCSTNNNSAQMKYLLNHPSQRPSAPVIITHTAATPEVNQTVNKNYFCFL